MPRAENRNLVCVIVRLRTSLELVTELATIGASVRASAVRLATTASSVYFGNAVPARFLT